MGKPVGACCALCPLHHRAHLRYVHLVACSACSLGAFRKGACQRRTLRPALTMMDPALSCMAEEALQAPIAHPAHQSAWRAPCAPQDVR